MELESVITLICIAVLLLGAYAIYQHECSIHNVGEIKTIGLEVYEDANLTIPLTNIDWGFLEPSDIKNFEAYVKSNSSIPITLRMNVTDWNPTIAESYLTLAWNMEGHSLNPNESSPILFTLSVDSSIENITTFEFDIVLHGEA